VYKEIMDADSETQPTFFADSMRAERPPDGRSTKERRPRVCEGCAFKAELFESRQQAGYWQSMHQQALTREEKLQQEVGQLRAEVHKLERQLFGCKSEKSGAGARDKAGAKGAKSPRKRGRQPGQPPPKRRSTSHLPVQEEHHTLPPEHCQCSRCGLPFREGFVTEDSEVIEIEVKAHKRKIRRQSYQPTCECDHLPGILTAPGPPKLIPKGLYGVSVWETILLDKYCFLRPTNRLLQDLKTHGLDLSLGTVTGGLKKLEPLFEPIADEITRHNLSESQWHADETSWPVFVVHEEKVGWNWKLWVFQSQTAVDFVLDPTRKARVPQEYFQGVERGVLVVDRYSAYKAMEQVKKGLILLAFCWVHVRRDFHGVAADWPEHAEWGLSWVEAIGELFHLNNLRLKATPEKLASRQKVLEVAVGQMEQRREQEMSQEDLHPVRRKPLKSLRNHWEGLTRFVKDRRIPMDNNSAERSHRSPVCGRKQFSGSSALWSGQLAAKLFSLFATLLLWQINPRKWLRAYLEACAEEGGKAPEDAARFLPWNLSDEQRAAWAELPFIQDSS
jgi:transposase